MKKPISHIEVTVIVKVIDARDQELSRVKVGERRVVPIWSSTDANTRAAGDTIIRTIDDVRDRAVVAAIVGVADQEES